MTFTLVRLEDELREAHRLLDELGGYTAPLAVTNLLGSLRALVHRLEPAPQVAGAGGLSLVLVCPHCRQTEAEGHNEMCAVVVIPEGGDPFQPSQPAPERGPGRPGAPQAAPKGRKP